MTVADLLREAEDKMKKSLEATRHEFTLIRTGRASPAILESVTVSYYGADLPLQQVASVTVPEPRLLLITPFDKGALPAIEKSILKSDLNLTPNNDGSAVRLAIPPLTEERRKEFIKVLHRKAEAGHAAVRNVRHDINNHLRQLTRNKECGEDEEKRATEKVQKLTDQFVAEIDRAAKQKEQELLEV
ncbi:MAG: ribosome recycling factor [Chthonomonadales bacterium]|nr:ribosome recycling factor [Chthonomonadales bacterium]